VSARIAWYNDQMVKAPLRTKALSGLAAGTVGDSLTQHLERSSSDVGDRAAFNWRRLAGFSTFGLFWTGAFNHYWLRILNERVPRLLPKLAIQHGVVNPFLYLPLFYFWQGTAAGLDIRGVESLIRSKYTETLGTTWIVWIPVTAVVFHAVPERFQSVTFAGINVVWNSIISLIANRNSLKTSSSSPV
jgi:hypothetical protein